MSRKTYRARWIVPIDAPPIAEGRLVVEDGRVAEVGRVTLSSRGDVDFGDAVVLPGFVNGHAHLELTPLCGQVPRRGTFADWLRDLVAACPPQRPAADRIAAVEEGLRQSLAAGVTAIGDIGYGRHSLDAWRVSPVRIVGYLEVLGIGRRVRTSHPQSFEAIRSACESALPSPRCRVGLGPHAPYSVDTSVYQHTVTYAAATRRPICTHLAETPEELQFLADGTGPLRELLEQWGLWDGSFVPPGCSPVQYARRLDLLSCDPLLVHVNYASDADLDTLACFDCHVAFCPRSHAFFGHAPHRWRDMLARGIGVCIGTDSLASNRSLSVLDELRFLRRHDAAAEPADLLHMGTLAGAQALGLDADCGSLSPGKSADFVVVPLADPRTSAPLEDVLRADTAASAVFLRGEPV